MINVDLVAPLNAVNPSTDMTDMTTVVKPYFGACKEHNCYDTDCKDYSERVKQAREK